MNSIICVCQLGEFKSYLPKRYEKETKKKLFIEIKIKERKKQICWKQVSDQLKM